VRSIAISFLVLCLPVLIRAADQSSATPIPKLAEMLSAKDQSGNPIVSPEEQTYFAGLNDNLKELFNQAVQKETITRPEHLAELLSLQLRPQKMELLLQNNCVLCHSDSQNHSEDTLFTLTSGTGGSAGHMNLREVVEDVHFRRGVSCAGCHGGDPAADLGHDFVKEWPEKDRQKNRAWVVQFCARCHSDPAKMHEFNPSLPTDQLAKFKDSPHGRALLEKHDDRAPSCVSCHGVHGIRPAKDPLSKVYAQRVPETCGACHSSAETMAGFTGRNGQPLPTNQLAEYRTSVHGEALLKRGDLGAPACNTCHGNHAASPPGVAEVSRSCSLCHSANASLFDGSKHKQAFDQHNWPECGQCHSNHAIKKTNDDMLATGPGQLCAGCHSQFAQNNPDCIRTAEYFHQTITSLDAEKNNLIAVSENLAAKGLDVEPINNQVTDLSDNLKKARTYVHSFSRSTFQQVAAPGEEAARQGDELVKKAREEYRYRQTGLLVSIGFIGLLMLAIYLKLRQMEAAESSAKARETRPAVSTEQTFFPRGAIFFFGILIVFYAALWLIIYWLMIARS
jgi:predicted CXXCH cytochrome family protein